MRLGFSRLALGASLAGVLLFGFAGAAQAATLTVTNQSDSGPGSLRATIFSASPGDTVVVPASSSHYQVTSGEIPITVAPLTIQGAGASSSVIDATGGSSRVFDVTASPASSQTVTFQGVTITGGNASGTNANETGGGGILVNFVSNSVLINLALLNAVVTGNSATFSTGASNCCVGGGGVYNNSGTTTLTGSSVTNNTATLTGGTGSCCNGGGGIYTDERGLTLVSSAVTHNSATVTSSGDHYHGGGGIYDDAVNGDGPITISAGSQVSNNSFTLNGTQTDITGSLNNCCSGGGGIYQDNNTNVSVQDSTLDGNSATISSGQCCHGGGAIYMDVSGSSGTGLTVTNSTQDNNTSTVNGPSGNNGGLHCCSGGGADSTFGFETLQNSTLDGNTSSVTAGDDSHGGGAVQIDSLQHITAAGTTFSNNQSLVDESSGPTDSGGGAVYEDQSGSAENTYTNSTFSGNSTNASSLVAMGGGGIYVNKSSATSPDVLANVTIAGNSAPNGYGGGVYNLGSTIDTKNSIIANNTAFSNADCTNGGGGTPVYTSLGYNLTDSPDTCNFTATGDKVVPSSTVGLGPLANNGGPTQTRALLPGSPAIDAGNPSGCTDPAGNPLTIDQRGLLRPAGARCDIGAFELQLAKPTRPSCTLKAKNNKVLLHPRKKQKRLKDVLQLTVTCNQTASLSLIGKLKEKKGKHSKSFSLSVSKSVTAGQTLTILLKLPKKALSGKPKDSVNLTLSATNTNGSRSTELTVSKLKVKKH